GIDGVERRGVVLLIADSRESATVGLDRVQLSEKSSVVLLREAESHEAAVARRRRGGEILADGPSCAIHIVVEVLPQKVPSGIDLRHPWHLRDAVEKLQVSDAREGISSIGSLMDRVNTGVD